jgi:hypothetical protein
MASIQVARTRWWNAVGPNGDAEQDRRCCRGTRQLGCGINQRTALTRPWKADFRARLRMRVTNGAILHAIPLTGGDDDQFAVSGCVPVIGGKCRVFTERAVFRKLPQGLPTGGGG